MENIQSKHVAIIGGGIAGLATAYWLQTYAREAGISIRYTLFESSSSLGGKIQTEKDHGLVIEGGPDSFLAQKPWAAQLALKLGLETELIGTNSEKKKLFVINRGRLTPMPDGVMLIIPTRFMPFIRSPLISWPGKIRMGLDLFIPRRRDDADESVADFIRRRLGKEALVKIAEPLLSGIHVSDPEQQSILGTFPRFRTLEKQYGSLIRGMLAQRRAAHTNGKAPAGSLKSSWKSSVFISMRKGLSDLVEAISADLTDGQVRIDCEVANIRRVDNTGYRLTTVDGEIVDADAVVLATPAFVSADLIATFLPGLSAALRTIRYVSTATVSLAYSKVHFGDVLPGVGFIIPRTENRKISACTMTSYKFNGRAPEGQVLLRCFVGGPGHEDAVDKSDDEMIAGTREELAALLGLRAEPIYARVYRWIKGNAQYDVGHLERVKQMHASCPPGLILTGSAYEGIGIPDCIHQGQQAAEKVIATMQSQESRSLVNLAIG